MITRSLISWPQLTRTGTPQFLVCRRPLLLSGQEFAVGTHVPSDIVHNRSRLRQLYEQRRIELVVAPPNSKQAHRPPTTLSASATSVTSAPACVGDAVPTSGSTPPTPVSKPASAVPVSDLPFESTPVPVRQDASPGSGRSSGYRPARSK